MTFADMKLKIRDLKREPCSTAEAGILDLLEEIVDCLEQGNESGARDEQSEPPCGVPGWP